MAAFDVARVSMLEGRLDRINARSQQLGEDGAVSQARPRSGFDEDPIGEYAAQEGSGHDSDGRVVVGSSSDEVDDRGVLVDGAQSATGERHRPAAVDDEPGSWPDEAVTRDADLDQRAGRGGDPVHIRSGRVRQRCTCSRVEQRPVSLLAPGRRAGVEEDDAAVESLPPP
ncbi:hypothetical protein [Cellulomonas rhizosphaerae]|uniref:hypothetical protein n=1 Tax=Cellulomonas rhizosphaerae TaxID=2293719 RepID=UPI001314FA0B|nr:hypothetical protein [Cellulomonas rhizosphaerae]